MSVGPAEDYEHHTDCADAAAPTRPSERGAWRHHWDDDDKDTGAVKRRPVMPTWWLESPAPGRKQPSDRP